MMIRIRTLYIVNLAYCYLPCLLFLFGWCRLLVSVPASLFLIIMAILFVKHTSATDNIRISKPVLIATAVISASLCLIIGFGGLFANYNDYIKHSAVIQDLVLFDWPVIYSENEPAMLTYYIGQYMFPALFGKILHSTIAAELLMGVFGWFGVYLLYLNMVVITKADNGKKQLCLLVMFFFFSGMLLPIQAIAKLIFGTNSISIFDPHWFKVYGWMLQYRSTLTAIKWVYPQYIVPCLGAAMWLRKENYRDCAFLILPSIIFGTWGFLCLVMITVGQYLITCILNRRIDHGIFSIQNIVVFLIGCVFFLYFMGNLADEKPDYSKMTILIKPKYYLYAYMLFVLFMFGFYVMLVWKDYKRDTAFISVVAVLFFIPCFHMGYFNDFVMCVSMPALFLLSSYVIRTILNSQKLSKQRRFILLVCLLVASVSPIVELISCFPLKARCFPKRSLSVYTDRNATFGFGDDCMKYNYFTYYPENTFFYKYLSKK